MTDSTIPYLGFENPEHTYYGANSEGVLPAFYTGGYQIRQYGVGGADTLGQPPSILNALDPNQTTIDNMVTAYNNATGYLAGGASPVTQTDKDRYSPAT